jgi:Zn-dependent protease/CBS domain-containing protein
MFSNAFRIGSIRGIAIRLDLSWFIIAALFAFGFWGQFQLRYGHDTPTAIAMAIVAAGGFFGSVLAHELAHALEAKHRGVDVGGITLFLFGGVTETKFDVEGPKDEFAISAVGPYISFVVAAVFGLVSYGSQTIAFTPMADVAGLLGWLNLLLGVFNLLPGAPLDGGRIVRAAAWKATGDRPRAMRIAARSGQAIGGIVIVLGLAQAFILGDLVFGLFNAFIGWFLFQAAGSEHAHGETRNLLEGRQVREVVGPAPEPVPLRATVSDVAGMIMRSNADVHPVEDDDGSLVGVVHVDDVAGVDKTRRPDAPISRVMRPIERVSTVAAGTPVMEAIDRIQHTDVLAVEEDGTVTALLTRSDLERSLRRMRKLEGERGGRRSRRRRRRGHLPGEDRSAGEVEPPGSGDLTGAERPR